MQQILDDIAAEIALETDRGKVADYIPQLAHVDLNQFGIAVATPDGQVYAAGNASTLFSIQSISKVFTLTIGLGKLGDAMVIIPTIRHLSNRIKLRGLVSALA